MLFVLGFVYWLLYLLKLLGVSKLKVRLMIVLLGSKNLLVVVIVVLKGNVMLLLGNVMFVGSEKVLSMD